MTFPYPENKSLTALALAFLICVSAQAQKGTYAKVHSTVPAHSSHFVAKAGAVIKIAARSERNTALTWMAFTGEVSHYVLERSTDGSNYTEACVFFTSGMVDEPEYHYIDRLRKAYTGPLFYRLRVVGLDGSEMYTMPSISGTQSNKSISH